MIPSTPSFTTSTSTGDSALEAMVAWRDHGNQSMASQLVRDLSPLLHAVALRSLPFPSMAEDAVQTTWMKFFRSLDTFDPRIPVSAWLTTILKRVCWNVRRSFQRHEGDAHDDFHTQGLDLIAPVPTPREHSILRERLEGVLTAMDRLEGIDRQISLALVLDDESASEVAQRTGLKVGAVRVRACRLRAALRELAA